MARRKIPRKATPPNDAINFAALHWYALTIERICIQLYVTDRSNFDVLKHTLTDTLKALNVANKTIATPCGDCQDGWECCADGMCAPTCVNELD
jgi:hypothetical protein